MSALIKGIDISVYQPPKLFDWALIAKEFDFVIVRACFGVSSDKYFESHFTNAKKAGLKVGAYIFYRQTQGWEEQFKAFVTELERVNLGPGDIYPVVDLEWPAKSDGKTKRSVYNTQAKLLCETLAKKYGKCIIYLSPGFYGDLGGPKWMNEDFYVIWLSHYTLKDQPLQPAGLTEWTIWQNRGNTFRNKDGTVKIPGGRANGFAGGGRDIDTNLAKEIPVIALPPKPQPVEDEMPEDVGDPDHATGLVEDEENERDLRIMALSNGGKYSVQYLQSLPLEELRKLSEFSESSAEEVNPPPEEEVETPKPPETKPPETAAKTTRTKPGLSAILAVLAGLIGALLSKWLW